MGGKKGIEGEGVVTLLTDFGRRDSYVGSMKGVILSINPHVTLIDITHDIAPQQVSQGGFILSQAAPHFPKGTIHLAVVDPGVGTSSRRPVLIETSRYRFVGPDNGLFGQALVGERVRRVIHLTKREYHRKEVSRTFHGRDIFAPVAAHLSLGAEPDAFGRRITRIKRDGMPKPRLSRGTLAGTVLHIDRFGNIITTITSHHLTSDRVHLTVGTAVITRLVTTYGDAKRGEVVALIGSSRLLEIAKRNGSAARDLGIGIGARVILKVDPLTD
ncbi:MAG: S-adenosyl-l-methionine hydroxide adenosyltransferase family protein [Thermodesulfobacteriota bacterium]